MSNWLRWLLSFPLPPPIQRHFLRMEVPAAHLFSCEEDPGFFFEKEGGPKSRSARHLPTSVCQNIRVHLPGFEPFELVIE